MTMVDHGAPYVRLAIHADSRLMREALSAFLNSQPGLLVVGATATIAELEAVCAQHHPQVALLDAATVLSSADALRRLRISCPATDLVAIAAGGLSTATLAALARAGIAALVSGADGLEAILDALRKRVRTAEQSTAEPRQLTQREKMIVYLMGEGHSTAKIALQLDLRPRTVENHKRHIYAKLGVGSQSHAVSRAISLGLLDSPGQIRPPAEPGRSTLAVVRGSPGECRDQVMLSLVALGLPFVFARVRQPIAHDHGIRWHRGALTVVLVDPEPEDWILSTSLCATTIVVLSGPPERSAIVDVLAHGAGGLVFRDDIATDLGVMLSFVSRGHFAMSGVYADTLAKWAPGLPATAPELTARERDILGSIARGHTIRQTARALGIAAKTVENTQARLFRKLGARNRVETITIAHGWGLVDPTIVVPDGAGQLSSAQPNGHRAPRDGSHP
jgi:two-component system nitrate/nitrite response regulator NarL